MRHTKRELLETLKVRQLANSGKELERVAALVYMAANNNGKVVCRRAG